MSKSQSPIDSLMKGLRNLLASLPSEEEKAQLITTLRETRDFLEELRLLLEAFPTMGSSESLTQGISRLDILADRASKDAPLRKLMGLKSPSKRKSRNGASGESITSRAVRLQNILAGTKSSNVLAVVEQCGEPLSVLMELGNSIGLRIRSKERKAELVQRIATHIINERGYDALGGGVLEPTDAGTMRSPQSKAGVR